MTATRLRIDKLIEQKVRDRYDRIVKLKIEGYITVAEIVRDVMSDAKFSKHLSNISGTVWEDELIWQRYITTHASNTLRKTLGFSGTRRWESYVVPRSGRVARHVRWVPVAAMTLFEIKKSAAQKVRLGRATLAEGHYLQRLAIECEARGVTDYQSVSGVYEEAAEAAIAWMKKSA